ARLAVFDFSGAWYNPRHRHSALAHVSPMMFEQAPGRDDRTMASEEGAARSFYPPRWRSRRIRALRKRFAVYQTGAIPRRDIGAHSSHHARTPRPRTSGAHH